jgi:sulfite exporter TauE/SafE
VDCCSPTLIPDLQTLDAMVYFTTGLLMSLGHCTGMCGPLVSAYAVAQCRACAPGQKPGLGNALTYHAGRITAYAGIGLVLGLLGGLISPDESRQLQAWLALVVGALMLLLALGLAGWLPTQRWVESDRLAAAVVGRMRGLLVAPDPGRRYLLGFGNGLLPCGPVYAMALGTLAVASPWLGAGAMALYGLGTLPVLVLLTLGAGRVGPALQRRLAGVSALLVLLIALQLGLRGAATLGWIGHWSLGEFVIF